jgi:ribosomal protein L40E
MSLASLKTKVANWVVVCTLATAFLAAVVGFVAQPAAGANCARPPGPPTPGDWTVSDVQVCDNIVIVMDGNLTITGAGDLTIRNGGLKFVEDTTHIYGISVTLGGDLRLVNSKVWTEFNLIDWYIQLNVSISGVGSNLVMTNSTFEFPGTLTTAGGATMTLTNSTITRTATSDDFFGPLVDDNDDAPIMTFNGSTVQLFASRFEELYENAGNTGPDIRQAISLQASTVFTAVDSFLGVDFDPDVTIHNTLDLTGNSNAFLYGVTFDTGQNPLPGDPMASAITTEAGSRADLYRWADVHVVDFNQRDVASADINADFAGPETGCATFRETVSCTPPDAILGYLGKVAASWDDTDADGMAHLPLLSDWIDSTTMPNSRFVGAFNLVALSLPPGSQTGESTITFDAYPSMELQNVNKSATVRIVTLVLPFPELSISVLAFDGGNGNNVDAQPTNRQLTIAATVNNTGTTSAAGVVVYFYSVDVDADRDGYTDNEHALYLQTGAFIGSSSPPANVPPGPAVLTGLWTPLGDIEISRVVSAVVDQSTGPDPRAGGAVQELNEANNINIRTMTSFIWPDLHLDTDPVVRLDPPVPIANNSIQVTISVRNDGTSTAINADFGVFTTGNVSVGPITTLTIPRGATMEVNLIWVPASPGNQTIRIRANATGSPSLDPNLYRNFDYDYADALSDNFADKVYNVRTEPDLSITITTAPPPSPFRGELFDLAVDITNSGQTEAFDIDVAIIDKTILPWVEIGSVTLNVPTGTLSRTIRTTLGIPTSGARTIEVFVDARDAVFEPNELDNNDTIIVTVQAPTGSVRTLTPTDGQQFVPGVTISITGRVIDQNAIPIADVLVTVRLRNAQDVELINRSGTTGTDGFFYAFLPLDASLPDGTYTLLFDALDSSIQDLPINIGVRVPLAWWQAPFLGLAVWIWIIVIIGVVAAAGGGTAYVKFVGLGKLVECGECGAFIGEDSTSCPKCGVEFEKDMAKCSNCKAWIPVDVKQCPECGVEFATGEVEMADYEAKMRQQYEDVKRRFRQEASQDLGRTLNDREFEDWWRTQPTFVTFEDWLKEEEDMRRMGSKPCPVCSTLNSVTATVCHKCGTLLKEAADKPRPGTPPSKPAARPIPVGQPRTQQEGEEGEEEGAPFEPIAKKVVKKPLGGAPVVQKKVIRRPLEEQREGEEGGEGDQI